jgi:hypothetical protein
MRPGRTTPLNSVRPLLLAGHEGLAARSTCFRAADLDLDAVDPQLDTLSVGIGEQVFQGAQT